MILGLLGGLKAKVFIYGAIVVAVLLIVAGIYSRGERAGVAAVTVKINNKALRVKDAQMRAAANRPRTDDDLDRELRGGTF